MLRLCRDTHLTDDPASVESCRHLLNRAVCTDFRARQSGDFIHEINAGDPDE